MGKTKFIIIFGIVTMVMLFMGLVYISMKSVTNTNIQFTVYYETVFFIIVILMFLVLFTIIGAIICAIICGVVKIISCTYDGGNESSRRLDNKSAYDNHMDRLTWDKNNFPEKYETGVVWDSRKSEK